MTTERQFNGWSNYETWCVNVWLENNAAIYAYWREQARDCNQGAPDSRLVWDENYSYRDAATLMLAERLEQIITGSVPPRQSDVYADLLTAALGEVDWHEIARSLLADCCPVTTPAKGTALVTSSGPQVEPGRIVATPAVLAAVSESEIAASLERHLRGDWGNVCPDDALENDHALKVGERLLSVFDAANQTRFWIITEADRSITTVLLPSDY